MTTFNLTCEAVEATLPDYLDETLEPWVRTSVDEHLGGCARCTSFARELRNIAREAAALPALLPERDVWARIAGRIGVPIIESGPVVGSAPLTPTAEPLVERAPFTLITEPLVEREPSTPTAEPLVEVAPLALITEPVAEPAQLTLITEPVASVETPLPPPVPAPVRPVAPAFALPRRQEKSWGPGRMGLAAAALVLVTAATTSLLTVQWLERARTPSVASDTRTGKPSPSERPLAEPGIRAPSGRGLATDSSTATLLPDQLGSPILAVSATSAAQVTRSPEDAVYDKEINVLQRVVRRQRAGLDASTVVEIEKNLRTLDSAIAQIRAALKKDPGSSLLGGQASRALEMKVELLRRAAMLPSTT
jgi:hypothetical protein